MTHNLSRHLPVKEGLHAYLLVLRRRACVVISSVSDKSIFTLPHFDGSSLLLCQQLSLILLNGHQVNLSYQLNKKTHSTEVSWFPDILFLLTSGNYEITCERLPHFQLHSVLPGLSLAPPPYTNITLLRSYEQLQQLNK